MLTVDAHSRFPESMCTLWKWLQDINILRPIFETSRIVSAASSMYRNTSFFRRDPNFVPSLIQKCFSSLDQ